MTNFLEKSIWSEDEWTIYFSNLDILCRRHNLKKSELAEKIGVVNAYRSGNKRVSEKTITKICQVFNVGREWIATPHGVAETNHKYQLHGGWTGRSIEELTGVPDGMGMGRAVEMLADIYQSNDRDLIDITFKTLKIFKNSTARKLNQED